MAKARRQWRGSENQCVTKIAAGVALNNLKGSGWRWRRRRGVWRMAKAQ
jgi:hypothetical protein